MATKLSSYREDQNSMKKHYYISQLVRNSNYNLRDDAILKLPKVNSTKYGIKSWRYQAAQLWNTIPNYLRNIDTYHSFKRGLKELDLVGL